MPVAAVERLHSHRGAIFYGKMVNADFGLDLVEYDLDCGVVVDVEESSA